MIITKEEYEKQILEIRKKELESLKFEAVCLFLEKFNKRENLDLENILFEILNTSSIEDDYVEEKYRKLNKFINLKVFLSSLTQEQLESNVYLKKAYNLIDLSCKDCGDIIINLEKQMLTMDNNIINIEMNIPSETAKLLPNTVSEQAIIPLSDSQIDFVNLLDKENEHIYSEYNECVSKIDSMAEDIYRLQMNKMLLECSYEIGNNTFNIFNSSKEAKFITSFQVNTKTKSLN